MSHMSIDDVLTTCFIVQSSSERAYVEWRVFDLETVLTSNPLARSMLVRHLG
jgi:hypothetical protein